jgi:hypothetical protein
VAKAYQLGQSYAQEQTQVVTTGYRFQHLSNPGIGLENPGTDANVFDVGVSRFPTKGEGTSGTR